MMTVLWAETPEPVRTFQKVVEVESAERAIEYIRSYCAFNGYAPPRWFYICRSSTDQIAQQRTPVATLPGPAHRRRKVSA